MTRRLIAGKIPGEHHQPRALERQEVSPDLSTVRPNAAQRYDIPYPAP